MLNWTKAFDTFSFLDNHQYQVSPHSVECFLAAGIKREFTGNARNGLDQLQHFINKKQSWLFGHLGYDLKNEIWPLSSSHPDHIRFPDIFFFEPEVVIYLNETTITIEASEPEKVFQQINQEKKETLPKNNTALLRERITREDYMKTINQLKKHILRGDCYEINFCQEFFAEPCFINPLQLYKDLSILSPNPFSGLYRLKDKWLICASPERFLKKQGNKILSQPIKGTSKRVKDNNEKDELSKQALYNSSKDRSENVMVVDLVRNDLAMVCEEGSIEVDELFGIYSFPQVHQMISTISGTLKKDIPFSQIIKANFPMGSMTGAPKKRVMELIEKYEKTKRGIFSGALGYISPGGDFDFNVIIRSIMYNADAKYLSFQVGSGITFYSDPEKEWEECLMKAEAIKKILSEK